MFYAAGSTVIWKATLKYTYTGGRVINTCHYVPRGGDVSAVLTADLTAQMGQGIFNLMPWLGYDEGSATVTIEPVCAPTTGFAPVVSPFTNYLTSADPTSVREAAFLIQRVGAGPFGLVRGRARLGPFSYTLFTDAPRCRHMRLPTAWTSAIIPSLNAYQSDPTNPLQEVLVNRYTGIATVVDAYTVPTRRGAVWARAGFPQGVRGPDRH